MKNILITLFFPILIKANPADSLHIVFFGGATVNNYVTKTINTSSRPLGYRLGLGVTKELERNFQFTSNIWYQFSNYSNIKTNFYDAYYKQDVSLNTNITFQQFFASVELNKKVKKFYLGINAGVTYLIKSNATQTVEGGSGITAVNIYNTHAIYYYQEDSYFSTLNPFVGLSAAYSISKHIKIKYENNFNVLACPYDNYQYFKKFHPFNNSIILIIKI